MFKKDYLVSFDWESKEYGNGTGFITISCSKKIKSNDISDVVKSAQAYLRQDYKDNNEYFNIVLHNIVRL